MKRTTPRLLAVFLLCFWLLLTGCATQPGTALPESTPTPQPVERSEKITVYEETIDLLHLDMESAARRFQLSTVTENIDGSCTIHLTPEEKNALQTSMQASLTDALAALTQDGTWPFLIKAEMDMTDCSVKLLTEADRYIPERDRTIAQAIYLPTVLYLAFTGGDAETFVQHFAVVDVHTKTTIDTFVYPEAEASPQP